MNPNLFFFAKAINFACKNTVHEIDDDEAAKESESECDKRLRNIKRLSVECLSSVKRIFFIMSYVWYVAVIYLRK